MNKVKKINLLKNRKGITLIALVVTIIVLIILAGVSISLVLGDNGIITKAKEAKQNTELAKIEEEVQLNETVGYLESLGGSNIPTNPETPPQEIKTVQEMKAIPDTYMPVKTTLKDSNDNLIVVPEGFKIAEDSGINVTQGIVIEDNDIKEGIGNGRGNQYVWIPVGENIKKQNKDGTLEEVDINLGRYIFANGVDHKDSEGKAYPKATPILKQSSENYTEIVTVKTYFQELAMARTGQMNQSDRTKDTNTTALDLKGFIDSVKANGGYYIARYEASYGEDGKANSKVSDNFYTDTTAPTQEGYLWNNIKQVNAAEVSRGLYEKATTDLINSYAWDTAIVYIQTFSEDSDYSYQNSKNIFNMSNTGVNGDEVCNINDMASNTNEWTTEYSNRAFKTYAAPCAYRGGFYNDSSNDTAFRNEYRMTGTEIYFTFRVVLYI